MVVEFCWLAAPSTPAAAVVARLSGAPGGRGRSGLGAVRGRKNKKRRGRVQPPHAEGVGLYLTPSIKQKIYVGGVLLSHTLASAVPSALKGLASGFGMGPGVSPTLKPPTTLFTYQKPEPNQPSPPVFWGGGCLLRVA